MVSRLLVCSLVFLCAARVALSDLPIHCLNIQVAGKWVFELSADNGDNTQTCGHKIPDTNLDHFTKEGFDLEVVKKYSVDLHEPNIAIDTNGNQGTWTMVYDEGFEVIIGGRKFFAFNRYVPKSPSSLSKDDVEDYLSICDETLVGWFHNDDNTHWGCYHGKKIANLSDSAYATRAARQQHSRFRQKVGAKQLDHVVAPTMEQRIAPKSVYTSKSATVHGGESKSQEFLQLEKDVMFEPSYSFIELINSDQTQTWRAGVHRHFVGKRVSEMMRMLGYRKKNEHELKAVTTKAKKPYKKKNLQRAKPVADNRPDHVKYEGLPENFDWRNVNGVNYDSPVKNQGNCGSCYAMATVSAAEARVRIASKNQLKPTLSSQAVVSCSIYNQGCEGGYPYLVGKHAQDFGLLEEGCMHYSGSDEACVIKRNAQCDPRRKYFASNYSYIGGYYGSCSEVEMMRELYRAGPIMVAFDAPSSLFYYTGGIYTGAAPPHEGIELPGLHLWEKTNHAVVAVGWGVENGQKYWTIKNTWGQTWGENGYFRIRRGTDECGMESMASFLDITLPQ